MANKKGTKEKVTLGSGMLYMAEFMGDFAKDFADILKQLMTEENHAGWIKGGASIEYKPTMTQEKDDLGHIVKEILTDGEVCGYGRNYDGNKGRENIPPLKNRWDGKRRRETVRDPVCA